MPENTDAFSKLLACANGLRFEPHDIRPNLDSTGRYDVELDREFPLLIKLFNYRARHYTEGPTWHDRLELFMPVEGEVRFRVGEKTLVLAPGDIAVVDNLQVHNVEDYPNLDARVIVVSFMPDFICSLGSPSHDYAFLVPFYVKAEGRRRVLRRKDAEATGYYPALASLLDCYFASGGRPYFQAGCKAHLLQMLYHLAVHFHSAEIAQSEIIRRRGQAERFRKLFEFVSEHYSERINVEQAAAMSSMSQSQFMKLFKAVAGTTFVDYLTHVRLTKSHQLLRESNFSIAEIASLVGFSDQSYFDRRFKEYFGQTPRDFRKAAQG